MIRSLVATLLLFPSLSIVAQDTEKILLESGTVSFVIKNAGINVDGSMDGLTADIRFNPKMPQKGSISGTVHPSTIKTGIGLRDKHLRNEDYFDVENYPVIKMESKSLKKSDDGNYEGLFSLTIKETTKELRIPFSVTETDGKLIIETTFEIDRLEFGLGDNSLILSDTVQVNITLTGNPIR